MTTEAENSGKAVYMAAQTPHGHILTTTAGGGETQHITRTLPGPQVVALLAEVAALTARLAAVEAELARTRQHFRTRHRIGCAFTEESVPMPDDFWQEPADGR